MDHVILKRILGAGIWVGLGFLSKVFFQLLISILLARLLLPTELADYYLIYHLLAFVVLISSLGLPQALLNSIPKLHAKGRIGLIVKITNCSLIISLSVTLATASILYVVFPYIYELFFSQVYASDLTLLITFWLIILVVQTNLRFAQQGLHNQKSVAIFADFLPQFLAVFGLSVLYIFGLVTFKSCLVVLVFSLLISILVIYADFQRKVNWANRDLGEAIEMDNPGLRFVASAMPLWITVVVFFVLTKFDIWIIGYFLSSDDLAIYGTVLQLVLVINLGFNMLNTVLAPMISELYEKGDLHQLENAVRFGASLSAIPAVLCMALFGTLGGEILGLIFGDYFSRGYDVLVVLAVSQGINVLAGCCGTVLMYTAHQQVMMKITVISGLITIMLSLVLLKAYGVVGVAWANLVGIIIQNIFMLYFVKKKIGFWTFGRLEDLKFQWLKKNVTRI